ncbi:N-acetyl-gamma-glutamyl-phosphate reductase [Anaerotruncus sp. AF02-27]|jgi:N-acetyl-gamma-glutamyl-phosphate reductase|uniref:N-acetyl-gamma-glutamyl-phosphate reductase n=1 Tax=Anaerotruncus TaxID=244127 RepID=UPI000E4C366D|nr:MULTISPECIES: N-acetyl-gamma-glutamyl-phosphate reductase [Anaerotruncus]RGX56289.1 N-acetyl-gamma-glutamyl-phosphate reductase [Anaerotruncus sp. AF02-27]
MKKIRAGVIGATGYAGLEIVRLLLTHPDVELAATSSVSFEGQRISEVYPQLTGILDDKLCGEAAVAEKSDVVFGSLPHGLSEPIARRCVDAGKLFIDMGADFRLKNEADYQNWYKGEYADKPLHEQAVYSIPELHRGLLKGAKLIANPGCYVTSVCLGLAPAMKAGAIDPETLVIDAKSGATGAGRGLALNTHYTECNEAFAPYKVACHRHTPEIEQVLGELSGAPVTVTFVPHLLPVNRGIVSTMYAKRMPGFDEKKIRSLYESFYQCEPFVRVLPEGSVANLKNVKFSNLCHISLHSDPRTGRLIVVSTLDNMVKGAAGQAIQNMNLALGLEETAGLAIVPPAF